MVLKSWGGCGNFLMQDNTDVCHIDGLFLSLECLQAIVGLLTALVLILFVSGSREA